MKKQFPFILQHIPRLMLSLVLCGCITIPIHAADLISIKDVTLIVGNLNDGDSFKVNAAGQELHLRLYYVDCLETSASGFIKERIIQQQRHFALRNTSTVLSFGKQAAEFSQRTLSRPFTIHTSYAKAPGSSTNRYYAFVETADGDDLGRLLVAQGLARIHGVTRPGPDGKSSKATLAKLALWRDVAMLKRAGIWRMTDPDMLVKLHNRQSKKNDKFNPRKPYNLNTATSEQLQQISGIGPVLANRIIARRPYRSMQELLNVRGIGAKKLKIIADYITVDKKQ